MSDNNNTVESNQLPPVVKLTRKKISNNPKAPAKTVTFQARVTRPIKKKSNKTQFIKSIDQNFIIAMKKVKANYEQLLKQNQMEMGTFKSELKKSLDNVFNQSINN